MKFYSNAALNTDKGINVITSTEAFKTFLNAFLVYETNSLQQDFLLSNQIKIKRNATIDAVASDVTYIYDNINGKDYFFHVKSMTMLSSFIIFDVSRDIWAMEVMTKPEKIRNLKINKSNKNVGVGVYNNILITRDAPFFEDLSQPNENLSIVFNALYEIRSDEGATKYYTKSIAMFHIPFSDLKGVQTAIGDTSPIVDFAIKYISGITEFRQTVNGHFLWSKISVLKAYICETSLINSQNDVLFMRSFIKDTSQTMNVHFIASGAITKSFNILIDPNFEYYVGTKYANLKLIRTTDTTKVVFRFLTVQDGLEVKVLQGDRELDITKGFEINLTANEGLLTTQQKTNAALQGIGGVIQMGVGFASGNVIGAVTGVQGAANSFNNIVNHNSNASYTKGGDGYSTFRNSDGTIANPYVLVKYRSTDNELENAKIEGANFNINISSLKDFIKLPWLNGIEELHPDIIIQAEARDLSYFTLEAQEIISRRLNNGVILGTF